MNPELMPPPLDDELVDRLVILADKIVSHIDTGLDADDLISEFNSVSQRDYSRADFHSFSESISTRDFVRIALAPGSPHTNQLADRDLVQLIQWLIDSKGSESEESYWLDLLSANLPHPDISDLIYWPSEFGLPDEPTAEEILAQAKAHKVIQL